MIRIHVTRDEDDGTTTDLGELRLTELGARPAVYRTTADGHAVMQDVRAALACLAPENLRAVRRAAAVRAACPVNAGRTAGDSWLARLRRGETTH